MQRKKDQSVCQSYFFKAAGIRAIQKWRAVPYRVISRSPISLGMCLPNAPGHRGKQLRPGSEPALSPQRSPAPVCQATLPAL
jgi:hypothetical protein